MIVVSVCLPSDALSQCLPSYLGFSYLGRGVSLHGSSSKAQPLLLTSDVRYLLSAAAPDLGCAVAPPGRTPAPWGTPKKWRLKGTLAFAKSSERIQNLLTFSPSGPSVGMRVSGTHAACLLVASLSPVPSVSLHQVS